MPPHAGAIMNELAKVNTVNLNLSVDRETGMFHFDVLKVADVNGRPMPVRVGMRVLGDVLNAYAVSQCTCDPLMRPS